MLYEWDESKRIDTLVTRGVDFADIIHFDWNNATYNLSDRNNEVRWTSLGMIGNRLYHAVWTERGENKRTALSA